MLLSDAIDEGFISIIVNDLPVCVCFSCLQVNLLSLKLMKICWWKELTFTVVFIVFLLFPVAFSKTSSCHYFGVSKWRSYWSLGFKKVQFYVKIETKLFSKKILSMSKVFLVENVSLSFIFKACSSRQGRFSITYRHLNEAETCREGSWLHFHRPPFHLHLLLPLFRKWLWAVITEIYWQTSQVLLVLSVMRNLEERNVYRYRRRIHL